MFVKSFLNCQTRSKNKLMNLKITIPPGREEISIRRNEAEEIKNYISECKYYKCLEIGLAYGMSTNYILSSSNMVTLTSIDPFQKQDYDNLGLTNVKSNSYTERHKHISKLSSIALPELVQNGYKFDFIFIDGDHKFEGVLLDFIYSAELLSIGGSIVFDDLWMRGIILLKEYIKCNRPDFVEIPFNSPNIFGFKKVSIDTRDGMYFREFYTNKGFIKYHINRLSWENKTNLGKLIRHLKSIMKKR